jgi:hypothetical protein
VSRIVDQMARELEAVSDWLGLDMLELARAVILLGAGMCLGARMDGGGLLVGFAGLCFLMVWLVLAGLEDEDDEGQGGGGGGDRPPERPRGPRPGRRLPRPTRRPTCPPLRGRVRR